MLAKWFRNSCALVLCAALIVAGCSKEDSQPFHNGLFEISEIPFDQLADYGIFEGNLSDLNPIADLVPYDLNTPLFSNYASKQRLIYIPDGSTASYTEVGVLDFPKGTTIVKTFFYWNNFQDESLGKKIIETRLLIKTESEWQALTYVWNDAQTEANFSLVGGQKNVSWVHYDGSPRSTLYAIPNQNECKGCHNLNNVLIPLGPKVRNLNRDFDYTDGIHNQMQKLIDLGKLSGHPSVAAMPRVPLWGDETADLNERARAYIDINCAHCHNISGPAQNSALFLEYENQDNDVALGICKTPVAAGGGSGGLNYSIVPGNPDESIMVYRMNSTELDVAMPELSRSVIHTEGLELVREWISNLEGSCD